MRILLDLDCTLADFVTAAAGVHGLTVPQLMPHWPVGVYGMTKPTEIAQYALGRRGQFPPMTEDEWWGKINGVPGFWAGLEPLPWADALVSLVDDLTDDWYVVTSPSRCRLCIPEKQDWCNWYFCHRDDTPARDLGRRFDRLIPTKHKHLLAGPGVVLIDDCDANVEAFVRAGGEGIVFPAHHNSRHEFKADPMAVVRETLRRKAQQAA